MNATDIFARLWNGTEPGWVVLHHTEDKEKLRIIFVASGPTIPEVKAIRSAVPALQEKSTREVLNLIRGLPEYDLGEFESSAARQIRKRCEAVGLSVVGHGYQAVSHSLFNELSKMYLLIEDGDMREKIVEEAIRLGLPIRHSIA